MLWCPVSQLKMPSLVYLHRIRCIDTSKNVTTCLVSLYAKNNTCSASARRLYVPVTDCSISDVAALQGTSEAPWLAPLLAFYQQCTCTFFSVRVSHVRYDVLINRSCYSVIVTPCRALYVAILRALSTAPNAETLPWATR